MFSSRLNSIVIAGNGNVSILSPSDKRYSLVLWSSAGTNLILGNDAIGSNTVPVNGQALMLGANDHLVLNVVDHGDVVQRPWYGKNLMGGAIVVNFIEIMACSCESEEILKDALGHRMGDGDWHRKHGGK